MHVATATAMGSAHVNAGQPGKVNNQDALAMRESDKGLIAVLCDGCGSQPHSGTGADIGANIIAQIINTHLHRVGKVERLDWNKITADITQLLKKEIDKFTLDGSTLAFEKAVVERFLFTAIVLVVVGDTAIVASFGDGVVIIDDEVINIESPILNSPPYLGYLLVKNNAYHTTEFSSYLKFSVIRTLQLSSLSKGVVVGTDGLSKLVDEDLHHPALVQPKALQRWINVQTSEKISNGSFIQGRCHDDVTLIIVRTDEAQNRLFENRSKIAELKQIISGLENLIKEIKSQLDRTNLTLSEAEVKIKDLEEKLSEAATKAEEIKSFETKIAGLKEIVDGMRQDLPRKAKPVMIAVDKFLDQFPYLRSGPSTTYRYRTLYDVEREAEREREQQQLNDWRKGGSRKWFPKFRGGK